MKRRDLIKNPGSGAAAAAAEACSRDAGKAGPADDGRRIQWRLVTTWPANFSALGAAYCWKGKIGAVSFVSAIPF